MYYILEEIIMINRRQVIKGISVIGGLYLVEGVQCIPIGQMIDVATRHQHGVNGFSVDGDGNIQDSGKIMDVPPANECSDSGVLCHTDQSGLGSGWIDEGLEWRVAYGFSRDFLPNDRAIPIDLDNPNMISHDEVCGRVLFRDSLFYPTNRRLIGEYGLLLGPEQQSDVNCGMAASAYLIINDPLVEQNKDQIEVVQLRPWLSFPNKENYLMVGHYPGEETADWYTGVGIHVRFAYREANEKLDRDPFYRISEVNLSPTVLKWRADNLDGLLNAGLTIDKVLAEPSLAEQAGIQLMPQEKLLKLMYISYVTDDPDSLLQDF